MMNDYNKNTSPVHSDADRLFGQIAAELDLKPSPKSFRRPYRAIAATRYMLPRTSLVLMGLVIVCFLLLSLSAPAAAQDVRTSSISGNVARVDFEVERPLWIKSVSARLGNMPLPVNQSDSGYFVDVTHNGVLSLVVETISNVQSETTVVIDGLDDEAPHIDAHIREGNDIIIYLTDGEGEGVDWAGISAQGAMSRAAIQPTYYDEKAGYVVFPYPTETTYISVPDVCGNTLTAKLEPYQTAQ